MPDDGVASDVEEGLWGKRDSLGTGSLRPQEEEHKVANSPWGHRAKEVESEYLVKLLQPDELYLADCVSRLNSPSLRMDPPI